MSHFSPGDVVKLRQDRVSNKGGKEVTLAEELLGRVCRVTAFGTCWVYFGPKYRCRRLNEEFLAPAAGSAPTCTQACRNGSTDA
jgi:hypothetical protein